MTLLCIYEERDEGSPSRHTEKILLRPKNDYQTTSHYLHVEALKLEFNWGTLPDKKQQSSIKFGPTSVVGYLY